MKDYADIALLALAVPFSLWALLNDLKYMKIRNATILGLLAGFLVIGALVLPFDEYLWRLLAGFIVLVVVFVMFSLGLIGGGDGKFAAVMVMFVDRHEFVTFLAILSAVTLLAVALHRLMWFLGFPRVLTQNWESWTNRKYFPMGLGMGPSLILYLALPFLGQ